MNTISFQSLPQELIEATLAFAVDVHPNPGRVLCVNSTFHAVGNRILYTTLRFSSIRQICAFSEVPTPVPCNPRAVVVSLSGGTADFSVFEYLARALRRCLRVRTPPSDHCSYGQSSRDTSVLPLDLLYLRLNSHAGSPSLYYVYDCLATVNPRTFVWSGPDPGHHFSIAIVPIATYYLLEAIATWTAIEHITLTNISFPFASPSLHAPLSQDNPLLTVLPPLLRTLHLERATFLPSRPIALLACQSPQGILEEICLVDAYQESIWGRRLRRSDVENAAVALAASTGGGVALDRVREVVRCEARHERIIGGDRSDTVAVLL